MHRLHKGDKEAVYPYWLSVVGMCVSGMRKNDSGYWWGSANTFDRGAA